MDFKPGHGHGAAGRQLFRRPLACAAALVVLAALALIISRSPEPAASMLSGAGPAPRDGVAASPDHDPIQADVQAEAPDDSGAGQSAARAEAPRAEASNPETASPARNWAPGPFLDMALPLPNYHDLATGESLLMLELISLAPEPPPPFESVTVRSGDSLAAIFSRAGLSPGEVHRVVNADDRVKALQRIYPGDELLFRIDQEGRLQALRYSLDSIRTLQVDRDGDDFLVGIHEQALETRVLHATGIIDRSFFLAGRRSGLSHSQLMQFMSIFEWQLDFNRDIRAGDAFSVVYEADFLDEERVGDGRILAAKLINRGRPHNAMHFQLADGESGYFGVDGQNMRKAFLRRPVQNARISSSFNRNRMHPVLGIRRPHLGTDFAAPTGTPILASGSGRVIHKGRKGGYGHTVIIQHSNQYRTLYAHLSRYAEGIRNGSSVEQGQIIGYVGRSGLASGPHLHYELMVNGSHTNPMTAELPSGNPVPEDRMSDFRALTTGLLAQIQTATQSQLAMSDDD